MKELFVTDTHLGVYNDSDLWLDIVLDFFKHIVKYCVKNKIKRIYHLGDFFNNRKSLNTKTQHTAHRIAKILGASEDLEIYIIVGNHDCYYKNQIHPNTLELFSEYKNIHIVDKTTKIDDILLVPWGEVPESTQGAKYCLGHFDINGFYMNDSAKSKNGIDRIKLKDFERVFSGHFHTPSSNDNIVYLGAPYGMTFNDAGGVRGYHLFEDGKLEFIEYKEAPKFVKIHTSVDTLNEEEIKDNIVRIIFTRDLGTTENQNFIDNVLKYKPLLYSVNFANMGSEEDENDNESIYMESKEKMVDLFIDEQTFATNINIITLKSMFKKLMKEAGEMKYDIKIADGTKIQCEEIGFQNFLSFGSRWQDIKLHDGVNFVVGMDKDKGKSNGAGKSSFLETIPFALFGKTAREITQNQIINWKNKKNCLVVFRFRINDDLYEIKRGLKPNILEIYKNGDLINQDANKTDYQSMFEDIFGMDIKMFMNLIHSNVNNSGSILNMKKAEKRAFLEKMFGLEIYSSMNKLSNDKLREIENKKYKIDTDIESADGKIKSCNNIKEKFALEIYKSKESVEDVDEIKEKLDKLIEDNPTVNIDKENTQESIKNKKDVLQKLTIDFEKSAGLLKTKYEIINNDLKRIENQEEQRKKNIELKAEINKITKKSGDVNVIIEKVKKIELELEIAKREEKKLNELRLELHKKLAENETNLKNIEKDIDLLKEGICPVCGNDVTDIENNYIKEQESLKINISNINNEITNINDNIKKTEELISSYENKIRVFNGLKDKLVSLESQIKDVEDEKEKDKLLNDKNVVNNKFLKLESDFNSERSKYNREIEVLNNKIIDLEDILSKIRKVEMEYKLAISKADEIKKNIETYSKMIKEQDEEIEKIKEETKISEKNKIKLNSIMDYINSIKFILKDENIKQFTIKQIMPFLNKQTNYYLSEVNYGFYVSIDKWLDVDIKGPGIRDATYGSLSGGERRGIDIALQLSLLDIARTQAGLFPDILVFDELLDSSIDSRGINELMKIVKFKQKEFGGKIFVISHRDEIDSNMIDHQYTVIKENGYSKVNI